tara:strand:- start:1549 stop:2070 length:522 start_codon:yes stop_codon:yes gene_type:complete
MSIRFLQSSTPQENQSIKVNDITVRGNVVADNTITAINGIDSQGVISAKSFKQKGAFVPAQQLTLLTNPIDCTSAVAGQRLFQLRTISTTLAAGSTDLFNVNLAAGVLSQFSQVLVSTYDYSNSYASGGTPFVFVASIDPSVNRVQLAVKNLANGQALAGVLVINMTIIGGSV